MRPDLPEGVHPDGIAHEYEDMAELVDAVTGQTYPVVGARYDGHVEHGVKWDTGRVTPMENEHEARAVAKHYGAELTRRIVSPWEVVPDGPGAGV